MMSLIAVTSCIVILLLGGVALIYGDKGYSFDLRGKQKGSSKGRRAGDRHAA